MSAEPTGFREYVEARSSVLLRTAWMLTGDPTIAEDLLQTALARTWPHWHRVATGNPDAYVRTVMVRLNTRWQARFWNRERPGPDAEREMTTDVDEYRRVDDRIALATALAALPVRQRQVVVLRYFDDLSVNAVAEIMGCSPGTVKSQAAKAVAKLRASIDSPVSELEES